MHSKRDFLLQVLSKIARRYELKGRLAGSMKVGNGLHFDQLNELRNFFGVEPIRISRNEDARISFDKVLQDAPESFWLERIGNYLGHPLQQRQKWNVSDYVKTLTSRLQLGFPDLHELTEFLNNNPETIRTFFTASREKEAEHKVTELCFHLAHTIKFLQNNQEPVTISELGARFFRDSKVLRQGEIRSLFIRFLTHYYLEEEVQSEEKLLTSFNVYHDRLTVNTVIYGPIIYIKNGAEHDWIYNLYQNGEAATVSWSNLQGIDRMYWADAAGRSIRIPRFICCENEAPFSLHLRHHPEDALLFTAGFPNNATRKLYQLLARQSASCLHWGDTDPNGLRIAAILNDIHPLRLYRCDAETILTHREQLLPLTDKQTQTARTILKQKDFPFRDELLIALKRGWLEQESWQSG